MRKRVGKRTSTRDCEGGKEWSRKGPREAQREIERGQRNREPKSFERVRGSGREGLWRAGERDEVREEGGDADRDREQRERQRDRDRQIEVQREENEDPERDVETH